MNRTADALSLANDQYGTLDRVLRNRLLSTMAALRGRGLTVTDALGTHEFAGDDASSPITIDVIDPGFYRAVAANGSVGAGESYMDGHW
ncbi:MAG: SAM-dependent methyltransferase, partial [Thermomonas sp.]